MLLGSFPNKDLAEDVVNKLKCLDIRIDNGVRNMISRTKVYSLVIRNLLKEQLNFYNYENCEGCHVDPQYDHLCLLGDEQAEIEEHYQTLMKRIQYSDYVSACAHVFKTLSLPESKKDMINMFHNESALIDVLLEENIDHVVLTVMDMCRG